MDWITTSGESIDEAKSNALDQLGIVADDAEFEVINDVEKGLFGRIKTEARIRARVRPKAPAAKEEQRRRGGRARGGGGDRSRGRGRSRSGGGQGGGAKGDQPRPKAGKAKTSRKDGGAEQKTGSKSRADGGSKQKKPTAKSGGDGAERGRDTGTKKAAARKRENVEHEFSREDQEQVAIGFLEGLVEVMGMSGAVALADEEAEDEAIELSVTGSELGLLVGPKGSTLNAVQELTRTVVQRESGGARTERLRVDVAGYRERRTEALQKFARSVAEDVLSSGSEKLLEPMAAADRKVVHDTVNEMEGVETGSEGEEPRRRVVIRPAN